MPQAKQQKSSPKEDSTMSHNNSNNDDTESVHSTASSSKTPSGKRSVRATATATTTTPPKKENFTIQSKIEALYDFIRNYQSKESSRPLIENFVRLPSKRSHGDYYARIKQPIDMIQIQEKIKKSDYSSLDELSRDFELLLANAKLFYSSAKKSQSQSLEFKEAQSLSEVFKVEKKRLDEEILTAAAAAAESEASDQSEDDQMQLESESLPAKRKRQSRVTSSVGLAGSSPNERVFSTRVKQKLNNSTSPKPASTTTSPHLSDTTSSVQLLIEDSFNIIVAHKCPLTQRTLAIVFFMLPSAKLYPDYYQTITQPIDLKQIAKRIRNNGYKSLKQLETDLVLMYDNAKCYNDSKSVIFKDACALKRLTKEVCRMMQQGKSYDVYRKTSDKSLVDELSELTQNDFNKRLAEAEEALAAVNNVATEFPKKVAASISKKNAAAAAAPNEDTDEDDEEDEDEADDRIDTSIAVNSLSGKRNHPLMLAMWSLFDYMKDLTNHENNKKLIEPFLKLPSKRIYPDYFEEIKEPISLSQIKKKLNKRVYTSLGEVSKDFNLMFANALDYNREESLIYSDTKRLLQAFSDKYAQVMASLNETSLDSNEMTAKPKKSENPTVPVTAVNNASPSTQVASVNLNMNASAYDKLPLKLNDLKEKLNYLYNYMAEYQLDERELAYPFLHLPPKLEYPDYYNIIKKPIDMTKILHKINQVGVKSSSDYASIDEMCYDFAQMFENACTYNEPSSTLYKDALKMQRALFIKRDEINATTTANDETNVPLILPPDFVCRCVQEDIIRALFNSCMQCQDSEGRVYADSFLQVYSMIDAAQMTTKLDLITLEYMRKRVDSNVYKRLDVFQEEMFLFLAQIRKFSYIEGGDYKLPMQNDDDDESSIHKIEKIHRYSQLYRDTIEMQKHFLLKRDELCQNGDLLQSGALNFKLNALDSHLSMVIGAQTFDEAEALLVDKRFKPLEAAILGSPEEANILNSNLLVGHFYYMNKREVLKSCLQRANVKFDYSSTLNDHDKIIVCVLAMNGTKNKIIVQPYLRLADIGADVTTRKFFKREVFKSDLYSLMTLNKEMNQDSLTFTSCFVIGIGDYSLFNENEIDGVCESMYSTNFNYFHKLNCGKKWQPLKFLGSELWRDDDVANEVAKLEFKKRQEPPLDSNLEKKLQLERKFVDDMLVRNLIEKIDKQLDHFECLPTFFKQSYCDTIQYDTPPARFKEEKEPDEIHSAIDNNQNTIEEDIELMKKAKYYEQLVSDNNEIFKIGDHVYFNNNNNNNNNTNLPIANNNATNKREPLIIRIDRLWSIDCIDSDKNKKTKKKFYLRGPIFLRPTDIAHEPTRLFYTKEVFRELTRELTIPLEEVVVSVTGSGSKKCCVMSTKAYVTSRCTEIDERDVFLCEAKYSLSSRTFRKFTKGMRKFDLSVKCLEDEVYFLGGLGHRQREIQLRKNLSPILANMEIVYEESTDDRVGEGEDEDNFNEDQNSNDYAMAGDDDYDDEDSTFMDNPSSSKAKQLLSTTSGNFINGKKIRIKREKKSAYNIFSREFRKYLRDSKSSLAFDQMSKEVGIRWRTLNAQQRAKYEEKANQESIIEAKKIALEQQQQQQISYSQNFNNYQNNNNTTIAPQQVHTNHINHILATQQQSATVSHLQQQQQQSMYINTQMQAQYNHQSPVLMYQVPAQAQHHQHYQAQNVLPLSIATLPPIQQQQQQQLGPRQVQHKEAYIKYIANIRKQQQQQLHNQPGKTIGIVVSDCFNAKNSIDIRSSRLIKENKVLPPPAAWIENCESSDVLKHLVSLRHYMLADAVNIVNLSNKALKVSEVDDKVTAPVLMEL
jgi:protein polybromo-1